MMDCGGLNMGKLFPVVFFDGVQEIEIGNVGIIPTMNFKLFQSIMSQKIGISPHQITIYFVKYNLPQSAYHKSPIDRRFPVTNKFNFSNAMRERDCLFWVVLKRSRRVRRRKPSKPSFPSSIDADSDDNYPVRSDFVSPDKFVLLRRNNNSPYLGPYGDKGFSQAAAGIRADNWYAGGGGGGGGGAEYLDYSSNRLRALEREKERYLMSMDLNSNVYSDLNMKGMDMGMNFERVMSDDGASCSSSSFSGSGGERMMTALSLCDVCANAKMEGQETVPFHCCKCDATVTFGFRSPAGPIARPAKYSG